MKKFLLSFCFFAFASFLVFAFSPVKSRLWIKNQLTRSPSSEQEQTYNYNKFFDSMITSRLQSEVGTSFSNFTLANERKSICEIYPFIEVQLIAEGIAINGKKPKLRVRGLCPDVIRENPKQLDFFTLLSDELCDLKPTSYDEFQIGVNRAEILFELDEFPRDWNIDSVEFFKTDEISEEASQFKLYTQDAPVVSCDM